ncbi:MAG: histidine phosphatase family protein [Deltaproteobacteria bacterium]|nr:histidine phosphatase family protein [Deltaproteobacteria bacterium]
MGNQRFYVVRHAQVHKNKDLDYNHRPLSTIGWSQIRGLQKKTTDLDLSAIICSPSIRTITTGRAISCFLGVNMKVDQNLSEITESETWEEYLGRVKCSLACIFPPANNSLWVTHGGFTKAMFLLLNVESTTPLVQLDRHKSYVLEGEIWSVEIVNNSIFVNRI